ncbi:MAG TPA: hypothetical protein VI934_04580 [Candidatus Nanoarchaeia archaeon]|nr:hypothetical protein [Candidatus Nanoarchaeia archaeon]
MANLDPATLFALGGIGILIFLAIFIIGIVLNALMLWVTAKLLKLTDNKYKTALIVSLVSAVVNLVIGFALGMALAPLSKGAAAAGLVLTLGVMLVNLVASFLVNTFLIKRFYKLETKKSFLVSLIWTILGVIVGFVIAFIIGAILVAVLFSGGAGIPPGQI